MKPKILVAEDDEGLNALVATWLRKGGLDPETVFDGAAAIERLKENDYAAILLDMMMPRADGFDVIEFIRRHQPQMLGRIVVMTAGGESITQRLRSDAIYRLIEKPFDLREVLNTALECVVSDANAQLSFRRADEPPSDGMPRRVLIVDDDDASRELMANSLGDKFKIDKAASGREAVEKLRSSEYTVVLLDLKLPGVDGFGVIRFLQEEKPHMLERVVAITVAPEKAEGTRVGAVMKKPFDDRQLAAFIDAHLLRTSR